MRPSRWIAALALLALTAPVAASEAALAEAIERWIQAAGGATRLASVHAVRVRGRSTESGIRGRTDDLLSGGRVRRVRREGSDRLLDVCDGSHAWLRDWNGKVRPLEGRDLRDEIANAFVRSVVYAGVAPSLAAHASWKGDDDSHRFDVLELRPPGGDPVELYLDRATGLPSRAVRHPYDDDIVLEFEDWRTRDGVRVPFTVRETDGGHEPTVLTVERVELRARASGDRFVRPRDGRRDFRFAHGRSALGIPFNFENDHIMIECSVNGRAPIWFMFDTGADETILNKTRLEQLGLAPFGAGTVSGAGNATDFAYVKVAKLKGGGVELHDQRDGVIDLGGLERIYGMPLGGILGYDFVSRVVLRADYATRTVDLFDPERFEAPASGLRVPFVLENGHPHVRAVITVQGAQPIAADMVIDSGAAETANLTLPFVKKHRLLELARKTPPPPPNTVPGMEKQFFAQSSVRGELAGLALGSIEMHRIPVNLQQGTTGAYASESFAGTIGEGILKRFTGTYDYARGVLVLEPNAEFEKPFPPRRTFGVTFLTEGPDYTVFRANGVRKGSPADAAGFRKDDVVIAMDGRPAAGLRIVDVREALLDDGSRHVFEVTRAGADAPVTIPVTVSLQSIEDR